MVPIYQVVVALCKPTSRIVLIRMINQHTILWIGSIGNQKQKEMATVCVVICADMDCGLSHYVVVIESTVVVLTLPESPTTI
jgi:hypothetical protein